MIVFAATLLVLIVPILFPVNGDTDSFTASVTVGNTGPSIVVGAGQTALGTAAGSAIAVFSFNVTDTNGVSDINSTTANLTINKTGETTRTTTNCTNTTINANAQQYNCSIILYYYDGAGVWSVNASIYDKSWNQAMNTTSTVTINNLDSVTVVSSSISFSGSPGTNNNAASPNPQRLNNTGNLNYATINVTGYNFANGGNILIVGNVTMNTTDTSGTGTILVNNTEVLLANSTLGHGAPSNTSAVKAIYFWLDVPAGTAAGSYTAQNNWILEANQ